MLQVVATWNSKTAHAIAKRIFEELDVNASVHTPTSPLRAWKVRIDQASITEAIQNIVNQEVINTFGPLRVY
jgi:hypothetical protein